MNAADLAAERPENPELLFIGGTGRSGTHVLSQLLSNHSRYTRVPIEARFHVNPQGFPDLLTGQVSRDQFLRKLKRFWWKRIRAGEVAPVVARRIAFGRKVRGLHKVVEKDRFDAAVAAFSEQAPSDLDLACRNLFLDLLWPLAAAEGKPGLIEMSCFTIAESPTLLRLFPDAKLIHTVRDGRDAGSSKVSKRQKRSHPRDGAEGLRWWEGRLRRIEAGVREVPPGRVLTISLDELVAEDREAVYAQVLDHLGLEDEPAMRSFFENEMSASAAHKERWRDGLTPEQQANLVREYEKTLDRLEREEFHCAAQLRRAYERQPA
ncbi:MAG: sulfotransferase family protein [Solirubrobacterales bacterium]